MDVCGTFRLDEKKSMTNWKVCSVCGHSDLDHRQPLSLEEKMRSDGTRGAEKAAEKHFWSLAQPFFPLGFGVHYRNPGHWDITALQVPGQASAWKASHPGGETSARDDGSERAFRIRGEPGEVVVMDERWDPFRPHPRASLKFKSVMGAMLYIVEELMQEPVKPASA